MREKNEKKYLHYNRKKVPKLINTMAMDKFGCVKTKEYKRKEKKNI